MKTAPTDRNYYQKYELVRDPFPGEYIDNVLYLTPELTHRLNQIKAAVAESEKLIVVTSASGAGKTVLSDYLKSSPRPGWNISMVRAENNMNMDSLAQKIISQVSPGEAGDKTKSISQLHKHLEHSAKKSSVPVIIVDDAHILPFNTLEFILQLAELRYGESLFRIILFADEVLNDHLDDPKLDGLTSGLVLKLHLPSLSVEQTREYIDNRLSSSGETSRYPFSDDEISYIYKVSGGLPRGINQLARQIMIKGITPDGSRYSRVIAGVVLICTAITVMYFTLSDDKDSRSAGVIAKTRPLDPPVSTVGPQPSAVDPDTVTAMQGLLTAEVPLDLNGNVVGSAVPDDVQSAPSGEPAPVLNEVVDVSGDDLAVSSVETGILVSSSTEPVQPPVGMAPDEQSSPPMVVPVNDNTTDEDENVFHLDVVPDLFTSIKGPGWLRQQSGGSYVLQLLSASDIENVRKLLDSIPGIPGQLSGYTKYTPSGKPRYLLFYGLFPDRESAMASVSEMPSRLRSVNPWPTTVEHVLAEFDKASLTRR